MSEQKNSPLGPDANEAGKKAPVESKQKYFPLKPETEEDFKEPVSWLGGRDLISSLKETLVYALYGEDIDPRPWMKPNIYTSGAESDTPDSVDAAWAKADREYWTWKNDRFRGWEEAHPDEKEFWFDYIADTGDGQLGVYGVGCLCLSDLWLANDQIDACVYFHPEQEAAKEAAASKDNKPCNPAAPDQRIALPRGAFLFVGGDTAYHAADYSSIHERFQLPFRWAFASVRKFLVRSYGKPGKLEKYFFNDRKPQLVRDAEGQFDKDWDGTLSNVNAEESGGEPVKDHIFWDTEHLRPLFAVPANHDYYDSLDGFNRQFRRPPAEDLDEKRKDTKYAGNVLLKIPTFRREQEASYLALRLPFDWWFLGIDSENEKLDFRQRVFFEQLMKNEKPKKVIIATPEPTTVFGRQCPKDDKTGTYVTAITKAMGLVQPFMNDGKLEPPPGRKIEGDYCRLDLSGDVHHYARYWGPQKDPKGQDTKNYASLVAGGGGAFFDSTDTIVGDVAPRVTFPDDECSRNAIATRIFNLSNIRKGGYVQIAGAAIAALIYFCLITARPDKPFFTNLMAEIYAFSGLCVCIYVSIGLSVALLGASGYLLHALNTKLKDDRSDDKRREENGRFVQLRLPFGSFILGVILYLVFLYLRRLPGGDSITAPYSFAQNLLLFLHLVGIVFAVWVGTEYLNWLPLRFKFLRQSGEAPDSWISILSADWDKKFDRSLSGNDGIIKKIWIWWRKKSIENVPVYVVNICMVGLMFLGVYLFGGGPLKGILPDLVIILLILAVPLGLIGFAISTGAAYQKEFKNKAWFFSIGLWHGVLQLSTPFVLLYFGSWVSIIIFLVISLLANGSSWIKTFAPGGIGAALMKWNKPGFMFFAWVVYGVTVLTLPYTVNTLFPGFRSITELAQTRPEFIDRTFPQIGAILSSISAWMPSINNWLPPVLVLAIACYLGYRLSRIWFSWYLGVSAAFNGHNNEAGGAARIQGFKHILRVKVEEKRLTVYVIGFDDPKPELEQLRPRLVDKFTLECKIFPPPPPPPAPPGPAIAG